MSADMTNYKLPASLEQKFCGMTLHSPLVLSSGSVGFNQELSRIEGFSYSDVGAVVLNGTTRLARSGYPAHRLSETAMGLLSATGWQNPGIENVVKNLVPMLQTAPARLFANVCGFALEDYVEVTRRFNDSAVDAIELNLSCPDSMSEGRWFCDDAERSGRIVMACRQATTKPLIAKITANQADIRRIAKNCIEAGIDGLSLINGVAAVGINPESRRFALGNAIGGLSGPAIKPIALMKVMQVAELARSHDVGIIGQGGVRTADDALEFIIAGADLVGVCTGLYYDPLVCSKLNSGINAYLERHQMSAVGQLTASLKRP